MDHGTHPIAARDHCTDPQSGAAPSFTDASRGCADANLVGPSNHEARTNHGRYGADALLHAPFVTHAQETQADSITWLERIEAKPSD